MLFDTYIIVDWSARQSPSPTKPEANAIWVATAHRTDTTVTTQYLRTRSQTYDYLTQSIKEALANCRRVLVGFDFPLGYPGGFAKRLTGEPSALQLWNWLNERVSDARNNNNNRYDVAEGINRCYYASVKGPFWGRHSSWSDWLYEGVPTRRPAWSKTLPDRFRLTECVAQEAGFPVKTVWQLSGNGSVGSQVLLGLPFLKRLKAHPCFRDHASVWPFETDLRVPDVPLVIAEVYPSLLSSKVAERLANGEIRDEVQVSVTAEAFARLDSDRHLSELFSPRDACNNRGLVVGEEGWILGLPHQDELSEVLSKGPRMKIQRSW